MARLISPKIVSLDAAIKLRGRRGTIEQDGAYAYIFGSAGMGLTHKANRAAFEKYKIIPRMLRDATVRDLSVCICPRLLWGCAEYPACS